ncbi:MAG: hypothetical protein ACLSFZ_13305 [Frisingicoccus sp.]
MASENIEASSDELLTLVNEEHSILPDWQYFWSANNGQNIDSRAYEDLQQ